MASSEQKAATMSLSESLRKQIGEPFAQNPQEYPAVGKNVTQKFIESHLVESGMRPGEDIYMCKD